MRRGGELGWVGNTTAAVDAAPVDAAPVDLRRASLELVCRATRKAARLPKFWEGCSILHFKTAAAARTFPAVFPPRRLSSKQLVVLVDEGESTTLGVRCAGAAADPALLERLTVSCPCGQPVTDMTALTAFVRLEYAFLARCTLSICTLFPLSLRSMTLLSAHVQHAGSFVQSCSLSVESLALFGVTAGDVDGLALPVGPASHLKSVALHDVEGFAHVVPSLLPKGVTRLSFASSRAPDMTRAVRRRLPFLSRLKKLTFKSAVEEMPLQGVTHLPLAELELAPLVPDRSSRLDLAPLASVSTLTRLCVHDVHLDDLAPLRGLRELACLGCVLTAPQEPPVLTALTTLDLQRCAVDNDLMRVLARLPSLQTNM